MSAVLEGEVALTMLYNAHAAVAGTGVDEDAGPMPDIDRESEVCARVADLRARGVAASVYLTWRQTPAGTIYSCAVRLPDGTVEEPHA
jgi:hypothetical protein